MSIFGLQRVPDSNKKSDLKDEVVKELVQFFDDSNRKMDYNRLNTFLQNLKIISNINLHNSELNDHILKFLNFAVGRNDLSLFLRARVCLKFLIHQDPKFREDLIENMFEELNKNDDGRVEYFHIFMNRLLHSEVHGTITAKFIKSLKSDNISQIFVPKNIERGNPFGINFKKRKLDFTSTPLGKKPPLNEKFIENSLDKMCLQVNEMKADLKRPLTIAEQSLKKKLIENLQSML